MLEVACFNCMLVFSTECADLLWLVVVEASLAKSSSTSSRYDGFLPSNPLVLAFMRLELHKHGGGAKEHHFSAIPDY
ncbi:hypothetical protein RJT34_26607 [Clitoria ternatea]|uniref:Secreted protein n=1 Tax=Clitoria ternatea TaxID=43366 RepID=A0AAN9I987_CLITE